jgi:hypothetical protein
VRSEPEAGDRATREHEVHTVRGGVAHQHGVADESLARAVEALGAHEHRAAEQRDGDAREALPARLLAPQEEGGAHGERRDEQHRDRSVDGPAAREPTHEEQLVHADAERREPGEARQIAERGRSLAVQAGDEREQRRTEREPHADERGGGHVGEQRSASDRPQREEQLHRDEREVHTRAVLGRGGRERARAHVLAALPRRARSCSLPVRARSGSPRRWLREQAWRGGAQV